MNILILLLILLLCLIVALTYNRVKRLAKRNESADAGADQRPMKTSDEQSHELPVEELGEQTEKREKCEKSVTGAGAEKQDQMKRECESDPKKEKDVRNETAEQNEKEKDVRNETAEQNEKEKDVRNETAEQNEKEELLFRRLCQLMEKDKLYLQPELQRDELARILNTNRTYLSKAVTRFAGKGSITDFINSYRLQCAAKLLAESPELSIREVELKSGFNSRETFNRTFRKQYGMTPREFRQKRA